MIALYWWIMLAGSVVIFLFVSALLAYAWFGAPRPGISRILIVWGGIVMPTAVLAVLVLGAFIVGERLIAGPGDEAPIRIEAHASKWIWEFRYPGHGEGETVDVLHVPAGRDIDFVVTSGDVIHGFWIPRLGGKIDAIPGHENRVRLRAERPGVYGGVCAEFCGDGHAGMRFRVVAHAPESWQEALAEALAAWGNGL